jgi:hypothetical protein
MGCALDGFSRRGTLFDSYWAKSSCSAAAFGTNDWKKVPQGLKSLRENYHVCVVAKAEEIGRVPMFAPPAPACRGEYMDRKGWAPRISCHGAPPTSACAAFIKESRMEFANANKVYRKSGGSPTIAFTIRQKIPFKTMDSRLWHTF